MLTLRPRRFLSRGRRPLAGLRSRWPLRRGGASRRLRFGAVRRPWPRTLCVSEEEVDASSLVVVSLAVVSVVVLVEGSRFARLFFLGGGLVDMNACSMLGDMDSERSLLRLPEDILPLPDSRRAWMMLSSSSETSSLAARMMPRREGVGWVRSRARLTLDSGCLGRLCFCLIARWRWELVSTAGRDPAAPIRSPGEAHLREDVGGAGGGAGAYWGGAIFRFPRVAVALALGPPTKAALEAARRDRAAAPGCC